MSKKTNREFSWIDVLDISEDRENVLRTYYKTNGNVKNGKSPAEKIRNEKDKSEVPVVITGNTYSLSSNVEDLGKIQSITREEEAQSERLGEKIEQDFGNLEPSEPFGPVDPGDPAPGQVLPENAKGADMEEFDPYKVNSQAYSEPTPQPTYQLTKEEYENLVTKKDIKILAKALRKLRSTVEDNNKKSKARSRKMLAYSIFISLLLVGGSIFTIYYAIPKWFNGNGLENSATQISTTPATDEFAPTTVAGVSTNRITVE